jgi:hypothetical protein
MISIQQSLDTWVPQVQGQYINMDWNPTNKGFGAQCWDLAAHWSAFLGLPIINTGGNGRWPGWAGNMVDAFPQTPAIAAAYTLHGPGETGQPGDITVWGDSYWWYPATHVAVLYADKGTWLTCMSQNSTPSRADNPYPGDSSGPTTIQSLPREGLIGFIRPNLAGLNYQGTITPLPEESFLMALTDKQQEDLYHRICTSEGQQESAQKNADVLLRTTLHMKDGGTPILEELLAVSNDRLGHIKDSADLLPSLNADLRGEFDLVRARDAAIINQLATLLAAKQSLSIEDVRAALADAVIKVDVTVGASNG